MKETIVRICMCCEKPLDEESRIIIETRDKSEYMISHGLDNECLQKYYLDDIKDCDVADKGDDTTINPETDE